MNIGNLTIKLGLAMLSLFLVACGNDTSKEVKKYYGNGEVKSIEYLNENGKLHGESRHFKENGKLDYVLYFDDGEALKSIRYYDNGNIKFYSEVTSADTIQKTSYHTNGKIKMTGKVVGEHREGWWREYDSNGRIKAEYEFVSVDHREHLNQCKIYDEHGGINEKRSSYFAIELPDTLQTGKNAGRLHYYDKPGEGTERHLYVIIENQYDGRIKKDTFAIKNERNRFGIYAHQPGILNIKGVLLDREIIYRVFSNDSVRMEVNDSYKYFTRQAFVGRK